MKTKKFICGIALAFLLAILFAGAAIAQDDTPTDDEVNAIAKQLYCPVCENTPLDVCPTEACRQWRDLIRQQLADGRTEEQIKQYFVDNYGARVLAEPPRDGLNWLVYLVPPLIIVAGAVMLFRSLWGWTRIKPATAGIPKPEAASQTDEYISRIEEELKKRK
jgi:cytochrome c-type biogenesis protein CcmH